MSRFGDFMSRTFEQAKSHEPSWIQKLPSMPGSPQSLQDAFIKNRWNDPYGKEQNSMDVFAGGVGHPLGSQNSGNRAVGRAVGTYFGGKGINSVTGGSYGGALMNSLRGQSQSNQAPGSDSGGGMSGVRGQAPGNIFEAAPGLMGTDPNLYNANADELKNKGRYGDDNLLHVSNDELNQLRSTGKVTTNPETGLPEAFSFGNIGSMLGRGGGGILGPIGNMIGRNQNNQDLGGLANQASNASNPLAAPQRQQYQQQLSDLMSPTGASNFMQNDPSVQAQKRMIGDQMGATFSHSGNMPLTGIMGSAQLANAFGGQYNQRIQDLGMLGGFNQGNPYGGMPYTATMGPRVDSNAMGMGGMGSLFGNLGGMLGMGGSGGGGNMDVSTLFNNPQYMSGGGMGFD